MCCHSVVSGSYYEKSGQYGTSERRDTQLRSRLVEQYGSLNSSCMDGQHWCDESTPPHLLGRSSFLWANPYPRLTQ